MIVGFLWLIFGIGFAVATLIGAFKDPDEYAAIAIGVWSVIALSIWAFWTSKED